MTMGSPNAPFVSRAIWAYAWLWAIVIIVLMFRNDYSQSLEQTGFSIDGHVLWGRDFVNVYTSGMLVLQDRFSILYDVARYRDFQGMLFGRSQLSDHNYSYPPVTLFYTWLFALVPYPAALVAWLGLTGAAFWAAARPYLMAVGKSPWLAVLLPASLINIWAGHYGFIVGALWLGAWNLLEKRPRLAGVMFGLMIVKPHLAILAPLVLAWRREWSAFVAAGITATALVLASVAFFGIDLWHTYLTVTTTYQAGLIDRVGTFFIRMMPTIVPALAMRGASIGTALIIQAVVGIIAIVMLLRHMPVDNRRAGLATGVATFLVLPYAFTYDMTVVSVAAVMIFAAACNRGSASMVLLSALAFMTPIIATTINGLGLTIAPLLVAFMLFLMLRSSFALTSPAAPAGEASAHSA